MTISKRLLPDTVGHRATTGRDSYGKPTHGAAVSYPFSRHLIKERLVELPGGEVVTIRGKVIFSAQVQVVAGDLVVLPDGTEGLVALTAAGRHGAGAHHHVMVEYT